MQMKRQNFFQASFCLLAPRRFSSCRWKDRGYLTITRDPGGYDQDLRLALILLLLV